MRDGKYTKTNEVNDIEKIIFIDDKANIQLDYTFNKAIIDEHGERKTAYIRPLFSSPKSLGSYDNAEKYIIKLFKNNKCNIDMNKGRFTMILKEFIVSYYDVCKVSEDENCVIFEALSMKLSC